MTFRWKLTADDPSLLSTIAQAVGTVNAEDYGWSAGNTGSQNVTAFNSARDAAAAAGLRGVWIPDNPLDESDERIPYLVTARLRLLGVSLYGAGKGRSLIKPEAYAVPVADSPYKITGRQNDVGVITCLNYDDVTVQGVTVDCDDIYTGGICLIGGRRNHIRDCAVYNCPNAAMQIAGKMDSNVNPSTGVGYSIAPAQESSIEDCYAERTLWGYVFDGACWDCWITDCVSVDAVRRHLSIDRIAGYGTERNNGTARNVFGTGAIAAPAGWIGFPSQYNQGAAFGVVGDWTVEHFIIRSWPDVNNPSAGTGAPYGIATGADCVVIVRDGTIVGDSGDLIVRAADYNDVAAGSVFSRNYVRYAATGFRGRLVGGIGAYECFGNRFLDCTTPINASPNTRPPTVPGTVIRDNRSATARVDPGYSAGTVNIGAAATSNNFAHTTGVVPEAKDIRVMPTTSLGSASHWWVGAITSSNITIHVNAAPRATVTFQVVVDIT